MDLTALGAAIAAFTAVGRIEQIVQQPYGSLSMALSTHAGQNLGAKNYKRIKEGFTKGMIIMSVFSLIVLPLAQVGGETVMKLFVEDPEIIHMGATALRITSAFYFALGTIYVCRGVLNGIGDAGFSLSNGVVEVIGRIGFPILLGLFLVRYIVKVRSASFITAASPVKSRPIHSGAHVTVLHRKAS